MGGTGLWSQVHQTHCARQWASCPDSAIGLEATEGGSPIWQCCPPSKLCQGWGLPFFMSRGYDYKAPGWPFAMAQL